MKRALFLLIPLIMGCVQTGFIRPNPEDYLTQVNGLTVSETKSYGSWENEYNKSLVIIYYSEPDNNFKNYIVKIIINETSAEQLQGYNQTGFFYERINVSEQHAWFFDQGLIITEGTYADYGRVEYSKELLNALTQAYLTRFPPVKD